MGPGAGTRTGTDRHVHLVSRRWLVNFFRGVFLLWNTGSKANHCEFRVRAGHALLGPSLDRENATSFISGENVNTSSENS